MLTTFARLPDELVVCIFAYLTGPNIKLSRSVCRRFANVVDLSPMLQFFIELDYAGYAEASNPRSDLSFEEKCSLLRLHNTRIRNHTFTKVDRLKLGVLGGGFSTEDEMLTSALSPSLKDGILTQWSSVLPHSYMPLQLDVAQLPSLNTGISAVTQWRMTEHNLHVCEYDVEPACDLLVLLERVSLSPGATNIVDQDVSKYRIHFRTLSTNSAHPDAVAGYLPYESRTASTWRFAIQCLGDVVVAYPPCNHTNEPVETGLVMYNWTTGALLDMGNRAFVRYLLVVSKEVVVATRSTFTYGSQECPMGYLDIYSVNWVGSPSMDLVASLELPTIHSVPAPTPGFHGLTNDSNAFHFHLAASIGSHSSSVSAYTRGLPRIFEPAKSNQVLGLRIILPIGRVNTPRDLSPDMGHLYIPVDIVYETLKSCRLSSLSNQTIEPISWQWWGPRTRWIHGPLSEAANQLGNQLPGSRCMLFSRARTFSQTRLYVLDFNPHFLKSIKHHGLQSGQKITDPSAAPTGWIYQPAEANDVTPARFNVGSHIWLSDSYADRAVAPYAWSSILNQDLYHAMHEGNCMILLDAEHIVIVGGDPPTEVVAFTL